MNQSGTQYSFIEFKSIIWILAIIAAFCFFYRKDLTKWFAKEIELFRSNRKEWTKNLWKNWGEPFLVAAILAIIIRTFLLGPYKIPSGSMIPTFMVGDRIFVDKISYRFHSPERGDIIVFKYPVDPKKDFVKRLVAVGGDEIEIKDGKIILNGKVLQDLPFSKVTYYNRDEWRYGKHGQVIKVPPDNYFALGDNSAQSSDSRNWGFVPKKNLIGKAFVIWWPINRIKLAK